MENKIFYYEVWNKKVEKLKKEYTNAEPFQHIVFENFISEKIAEKLVEEFPNPDSDAWIHYKHANQDKLGKTDIENFGPISCNIGNNSSG